MGLPSDGPQKASLNPATRTNRSTSKLTDLLFLPFFGQRVHGQITAVSLLSLTGISTYLHILYFVAVFGSVLCGILLLALQACPAAVWIRRKHPVSMLWNAAAVLLFIISSQPYAATVLFFFLAIKAIMLLKRP